MRDIEESNKQNARLEQDRNDPMLLFDPVTKEKFYRTPYDFAKNPYPIRFITDPTDPRLKDPKYLLKGQKGVREVKKTIQDYERGYDSDMRPTDKWVSRDILEKEKYPLDKERLEDIIKTVDKRPYHKGGAAHTDEWFREKNPYRGRSNAYLRASGLGENSFFDPLSDTLLEKTNDGKWVESYLSKEKITPENIKQGYRSRRNVFEKYGLPISIILTALTAGAGGLGAAGLLGTTASPIAASAAQGLGMFNAVKNFAKDPSVLNAVGTVLSGVGSTGLINNIDTIGQNVSTAGKIAAGVGTAAELTTGAKAAVDALWNEHHPDEPQRGISYTPGLGNLLNPIANAAVKVAQGVGDWGQAAENTNINKINWTRDKKIEDLHKEKDKKIEDLHKEGDAKTAELLDSFRKTIGIPDVKKWGNFDLNKPQVLEAEKPLTHGAMSILERILQKRNDDYGADFLPLAQEDDDDDDKQQLEGLFNYTQDTRKKLIPSAIGDLRKKRKRNLFMEGFKTF
jgi:hypothetical protein